jgi:hypothetical protein
VNRINYFSPQNTIFPPKIPLTLSDRYSSFGILTRYGLGWSGDRTPVGANHFFSTPVQTGPAASQPLVQWEIGLFLGGKNSRSVALTAHSPCSSKIKNDWSSTSIPPSCLHGVSVEEFHFYLRLTYLIPLISKHPPQYISLNSPGHVLSFG